MQVGDKTTRSLDHSHPMRPFSGLFLTVFLLFPLQGLTNEVVVRPGETLSEIADRYGTSVERLMQLNGLRSPQGLWAGSGIQVHVGSGISSSDNRQGANLKTAERLIREAKALVVAGKGQEKRVIEAVVFFYANRLLNLADGGERPEANTNHWACERLVNLTHHSKTPNGLTRFLLFALRFNIVLLWLAVLSSDPAKNTLSSCSKQANCCGR